MHRLHITFCMTDCVQRTLYSNRYDEQKKLPFLIAPKGQIKQMVLSYLMRSDNIMTQEYLQLDDLQTQ